MSSMFARMAQRSKERKAISVGQSIRLAPISTTVLKPIEEKRVQETPISVFMYRLSLYKAGYNPEAEEAASFLAQEELQALPT